MIHQRHWCHRIFMLLALAFMAAGTAWASPPTAPLAMSIHDIPNYTGSPGLIRLQWVWNGTGTPPVSYTIYRKTGFQTTYNGFDSIASQLAYAPIDTSVHIEMFADSLDSGSFSYYIVGVNADGTSDPSEILATNLIPLPAHIHFTTTPQDTIPNPTDSTESHGVVHVEYTYTAHAEATNTGTVNYGLNRPPAGMTIDSVSGTLHWTPDSAGLYYVEIYAWLASDNRVYVAQSFHIRVDSCTLRPTFYGRVADGNGDGVAGATIKLYVIGRNFNNNLITAVTGQSGNYSVQVDQGTYLLRVDGSGIVGEWYQDVYERGMGQTLTLDCGDSIVADFTVARLGTVNEYTVSGTVTDQNTHAALAHAQVTLTGYDTNVPDSVKWETGVYLSTFTGVDGTYSVTVSDRYQYTMSVTTTDSAQGLALYTRQWYNSTGNSNDPTEASAIAPTGNMTGVDFDLTKLDSTTNSIGGYVIDTARTPVPAIIVVYRIVTQGNSTTAEAVQSMESRVNNQVYFNFSSLPDGDYVVFATPLARLYTPGYAKDSAEAVSAWMDASTITLSGGQFAFITMMLHHRDGVGGLTRLRGSVTASTGHTIKVDRSTIGVHPVVGALVTAVDSHNKVSNYAFTGADGSFEITGLGDDTYTVIADKVGYGAYHDAATLTGKDEAIKHDIHLESLTVSSVPVTGAADATGLAIFPNPASSQINLRLAGATGPARAVVTDLKGEQVMSVRLDPVGAGSYTLNADGLAGGIYFIRLQAGAASSQGAVSIVR